MSSTTPSSKPPILILDGGLGTTLQSQDPPPKLDKYLWSSTPLLLQPSALSAAHASFANAGADIIETATYQVSFPGVTFMDWHDAVPVVGYERAKNVMRNAVTLAHEAANGKGGERKSVALSLGPYGATMHPSTEYSAEYDNHHSTFEALEEWHLERLQVFTEDKPTWKDVDFVAFETFGRCDEVRVVRQVMTEVFGNGAAEKKRWWISCVFPDVAGGCLPSGESVDDGVEAMLESGVGHDGREFERPWGIGINCTKVSKLPALIEAYESAVKTVLSDGEEWPALVLYPDGTKKGEYYDTTRKEWVVDEDSVDAPDSQSVWYEELSEIVEETRNRAPWRAVVVGGCCRTGPEDVAGLRRCLH